MTDNSRFLKNQNLDRTLYIIAVISNPIRFRSRYNLYNQFEKQITCLGTGVKLYTVELAYGNRPFEVTSSDNPQHLQLRTEHELWHKENLINLGIARLPSDWQYVAWVDADVTFTNPSWIAETVQQLQHYEIVQMFTHAIDGGPAGEPLKIFQGFMFGYCNNFEVGPILNGSGYTKFWHPGYAWAARRSAIDILGGLIDFSILGSGDHLMAHALIGHLKKAMPNNLSSRYQDYCFRWETRAKALRYNLGYVNGTIFHHWHGKKKDRKYADRWKILANHQFDPYLDLKRDWQGLYQLTERSIKLRDDIRSYFRARNEDSIDLEN